MTPSAVTPAARQARSTPAPTGSASAPPRPSSPKRPASSPKRSPSSAQRSASTSRTSAPKRPSSPHRSTPRGGDPRTVRRSTAPRSPRRVSGPARVGGSQSGAQRALSGVAEALPGIRAPRTRPSRTRTSRSDSAPRPSLGVRALHRLRALPDHVLLDRVVRGRLWIPLLGVLLAGIVAMQVEVLKLNAGIGHATVRTAQLQSQNQLLRASVAKLSDDRRIESVAARMGMVMASPQSIDFLPSNGAADAGRAAANVHAPDPAGFAAQVQARNAAATASTEPGAPASTDGATSAASSAGTTSTAIAAAPTTTTPSGG